MATSQLENPEDTNTIDTDNKDNNTEENLSQKSNKSESGKTQVGTLLESNGFTVIRKIGEGCYSKVKLAYSENHKAMVAIKIVSKNHVPEKFLQTLLYNEIKVIRFLKHENIIKYYQSIETSQRIYIIMQHAQNGSLLELLEKQKRISEGRACSLFRQLMSAIEYCHSQGVAHRDIKCENILLDESNKIKLVDFGFAKCYRDIPKMRGEEHLEAKFGQSSTKAKNDDPRLSETFCGSFAYASPEILKSIPYDPFISDIWAMGVCLFVMVIGRLPFNDRHHGKLLKQVQQPIVFPTAIPTTEEFKACCRKIFVSAKYRATIEQLKEDGWIKTKHVEYERMAIPMKAPVKF